MNFINKYRSPIGDILLACDGNVLTGLWFEGQKYYGAGLSYDAQYKDIEIFECTKKWLDIYFNGSEPDFTPPLGLIGTPFRIKVWNILRTIPYGETISYKDIAQIIAKNENLNKMSARAVGNAVGHNPISLIIPCHRVIGSNGSITGYAGGIDKKIWLLNMEKSS